MSLYDLIIRNGTLVTPEGVVQADLAITDGRIAAIAPELAGSSSAVIDAHGLHVLPGLIDAHVHFNEPGRTDWEGFSSGTQSLVAGGSTSCLEMPLNAHPPTLDAASFDLKLAAAQQSAYADFALWGGLTPDSLDHMDELAECGVIGFKAFMSKSGTDDFQAADDHTLYEGMVRAARLGCLVAVHAEDDQMTSELADQFQAAGRVGVRDYLASRPISAELAAVERAIRFAAETGCTLHIVHASSAQAVRMVAEAQTRGIDVSCETCPHYLVLTEDDVERLGAVAKCAPPLRSQAEQDELWALLANGTLPMVASDHSPAPPSMKTDPNFFKIWGGISGSQSTLPLMLTEGYTRRNLPLPLIASVTSGYVARRFALTPRKGMLAPGVDADLALIDLGVSWTLQAEELLYRHRQSPYIGRTFQGKIVRTLVRGTTVYQNGQIVSAPIGRLLRPTGHPQEQ